MTIGLFFGTFDPIHFGHIELAKSVINQKLVEIVWFVVTPRSPFKESNNITAPDHRLNMVEIATQNNDVLVASDLEFNLVSPQYTAQTLRHVKTMYPKDLFKIIMGSDNYDDISKWYNYEYIVNNFQLLIYNRKGHQINNLKKNQLIQGEHLMISSSMIRGNFNDIAIKSLDPNVYQYVKKHSLYGCSQD
tara:strand:- start:3154 stop:3723 length:570 start_codon:yes stop_codon:yes gene_type:complete